MHVKLTLYAKEANFRLFIYRLNIALRKRKRQIWNGYFFLINENVSSFLIAMKGLPYEHLRNKFHFSEVHGRMNAMCHVQNK